MKYNNLIIYYFSGTGNAKNTAKRILKIAEEKGLTTRLINIDRFEKVEHPDLSEKTLIGFCSPTHGFNLPPIVLKYIWKFPKVQSADAFILNTRGGLKLHKLFLPGLSGLAQILPALILRFKGFRIVGMQPLDLPSNWLLLHPGLRDQVINSIFDRCNRIVLNFTKQILSGKRKFKALLSLPIDLALIPISLGYHFIGRFFLAKTLVASSACDNCGKCIKHCPVRAISMVQDRPLWSFNCHLRAIETTHAYSTLIILISSLVISPLLIELLDFIGVWGLLNQSVITQKSWSLLYAFIFLVFVFINYRILHFLMRYKLFNKIITYTSSSKYKFWRRYEAPERWHTNEQVI